jgi:hypothetical protein
MPVVQDPDFAGSWATGVAQNPSKFCTGGPTTVSLNTGGPARSVVLAFADSYSPGSLPASTKSFDTGLFQVGATYLSLFRF